MSAATAPPLPRRAAPSHHGPRPAVVRMQATHLLAGPASWLAALVAVVLTAGLSALYVAVSAVTPGVPGAPAGPTSTELGFVACSALVLTALVAGCVVAGQEWASGQQCYVLAAVPRRGALLAARWGVTGLFWGGAGAVAGSAVVLIARWLAPDAVHPSVLQTLQLVAGSALAAGMAAVLGVSLATLLRSTLWSVVTAVLVATVLPVFLSSLPQVRWLLPAGSLTALASLPSEQPDVLQPGAGLAVALGWSLVVGAAAWWRLTRDDV